METDLRPMTLGEILDRTAYLYRTNFLLFAGISAVYAGLLLVINLIQLGITQAMLHAHMAKQMSLVTLGYVVLIFPVIIICASAAVAANNRAVAWVNLGQPATIRGAYKSILPKLGRYLWLGAMILFFVYWPFVIVFSGYFGFLFGYARPRGFFGTGGHGDSTGLMVVGLVSLAFFVLMAAAGVYAVVMALRYSLALPASVVENLKARPAIKRSIVLSKGSRGRIFVLGLLIMVIQFGLVGISQIFFVIAAFTAVKHHGAVPVWMQVLQQIVGFFTNSFIGPMYATGLTLFYYDQRVRKEGYDIEWMMEAAGMTPAPASTAAEPEPVESPLVASAPMEAPVEEGEVAAVETPLVEAVAEQEAESASKAEPSTTESGDTAEEGAGEGSHG